MLELAGDPRSLATAEMDIDRRRDKDIENHKLWREKRFQHCPCPEVPAAGAFP